MGLSGYKTSVGADHNREGMVRTSTDLRTSLNQKLDELHSKDHEFGQMVAGILKKRKNNVKKAVMDLLDASLQDEPAIASSPMFGPPPPSGPYYTYPNPPPPKTHPYYPPCFRPYSDEYGNERNPAHSLIPLSVSVTQFHKQLAHQVTNDSFMNLPISHRHQPQGLPPPLQPPVLNTIMLSVTPDGWKPDQAICQIRPV